MKGNLYLRHSINHIQDNKVRMISRRSWLVCLVKAKYQQLSTPRTLCTKPASTRALRVLYKVTRLISFKRSSACSSPWDTGQPAFISTSQTRILALVGLNPNSFNVAFMSSLMSLEFKSSPQKNNLERYNFYNAYINLQRQNDEFLQALESNQQISLAKLSPGWSIHHEQHTQEHQ